MSFFSLSVELLLPYLYSPTTVVGVFDVAGGSGLIGDNTGGGRVNALVSHRHTKSVSLLHVKHRRGAIFFRRSRTQGWYATPGGIDSQKTASKMTNKSESKRGQNDENRVEMTDSKFPLSA